MRFAYDNALAHKIEAGADMFLMPSRFEPCGLTQMYSLRYGTVPIVRATGGLVDTVEPYDAGDGHGHRLPLRPRRRHRADVGDRPGARSSTQDRAAWAQLMRNGMARDFSWHRSAEQYVALYRSAMAQL